MTLNLDRTERKQFVTHLVNQLNDGNTAADTDECFDSLVAKYGERYGFDTLDSELEIIIEEALSIAYDAGGFDTPDDYPVFDADQLFR